MDRHKVTLLSKVHACTGLTSSCQHLTWASQNGVCLICGERVVLWLVRRVLMCGLPSRLEMTFGMDWLEANLKKI